MSRPMHSRDDIAWPWCTACKSWHHPNNPTCKKLSICNGMTAENYGRMYTRNLIMPIIKKTADKKKRQSKSQPSAFTLELLTQAIVEQWPTDPTTPGVVCSFLPYKTPDERFYVSIVRYDQRFGQGKRVIFNAAGSSFDDAARKVAELLVRPTALSRLVASL